MTLYFIGLGLGDEKDISVKGLEKIKESDVVYLESYTSLLSCTVEDLEKLYEKKIIQADRSMVEGDDTPIIQDAKDKTVSFLVIGDPMCATTHTDLYTRAKELGIKTEVIHNASIMSAIGVTGLQVYKFGKTTSIPFENENVISPYTLFRQNQEAGMHTLFLLDLRPQENKYMTVNQALEYLKGVEEKEQGNLISEDTLCIGCARVGSSTQMIKAGKLKDLLEVDFGDPVHCLIIPGDLHFMEEEFLENW